MKCPLSLECQVVKSDLFAYKDKKNMTMAALQQAFVRMMNSSVHNPTNGRRLWYFCGKGDWKHKKDWLCERRYWSQNSAHSHGICRRCFARGSNWMDVVNCTEWHSAESALDSAFDPIPFLVLLFCIMFVLAFVLL